MSYKGKCHDTHRIAYTEFVGDIPDSMIVMHSCDNPPCFNPEHLYLGTQKDNMHDMANKMRRASGESLSKAIKDGWTTELRAKRAKQMSDRRKEQYRQRQRDAGVPFDYKFCSKSSHWLPLSAFGKNRARHDGVNSYCNDCRY